MRLRRLADDFDLPIVIHVQETRLQVVTGEIFYSSTMIEYLDRIGFLRSGVSLIHGVWLTPREIEILARSGATLQHNPTSNISLGSGLCPVRELIEAGVNVSLGTDACGSSFTVNMLKAVNSAALVQKLRTPDYARWVTAQEAWTAGTVQEQFRGAPGLSRYGLHPHRGIAESRPACRSGTFPVHRLSSAHPRRHR